jgi:oligoendopeptidase F
MPRQAMITEFEHKAHQLVSQKGNVSGSDLNALWDNIADEYKSDNVAYYFRIEPEWPYISHIYLTDNYYFNLRTPLFYRSSRRRSAHNCHMMQSL